MKKWFQNSSDNIWYWQFDVEYGGLLFYFESSAIWWNFQKKSNFYKQTVQKNVTQSFSKVSEIIRRSCRLHNEDRWNSKILVFFSFIFEIWNRLKIICSK